MMMIRARDPVVISMIPETSNSVDGESGQKSEKLNIHGLNKKDVNRRVL